MNQKSAFHGGFLITFALQQVGGKRVLEATSSRTTYSASPLPWLFMCSL